MIGEKNQFELNVQMDVERQKQKLLEIIVEFFFKLN